MKSNKIFKAGITLMAAMAVTFSGITGERGAVLAADYTNISATVPKAVLADVLKPYNVTPGDVVDVVIPVKASNYRIKSPIISVDFSKAAGFSLASEITYTDKNGNTPVSISVTDTVYVKFSVRIPLNAKKGTYDDIPITFVTTDSFGEYAEVKLNQVSKLSFIVGTQKKNANFSLADAQYPREIREEEDVNIRLSFENTGELAANNVKVSLTGYESTLLPDDSQPSVSLGDIAGGGTGVADFSFSAIKKLPGGVTQLTATVKYENSDGSEAAPQTFAISMQTIATETVKAAEDKPVLQVTSANYPRYTVNVGDKFDVEYQLTNTGKVDAKNVVVDTTGYSEAGLKPDKAYDKIRLASLKAGKSVKIKRTFIATEVISTGVKPITLSFTYYSVKDNELTSQITDTMSIYIDSKGKDTTAQGEVDNSVPRLTVAKYDTGEEKVMAGKIFNFTFDVLNTHTSLSAENVVATVSSTENQFSIVEGSPSFLINSLKAGERKTFTIPLRVKGDIATNGYDLIINFDYEYLAKDTANNNVLVKKQNKVEEKLKLQVYSNDRPMLSNILVGAGETPVYMESTAITFDFNNMGKSILYNVTAKITGDFKPTNEILIIGNVEAGTGRSWSVDVTPETEFQGKGVVTISYEDSNGNVSSYDTEFESIVNSAEVDNGDININPVPVPEETKDIIPMWLFIVINILVFIIGSTVVKKRIIKRYKKRKLEEAMREDEQL